MDIHIKISIILLISTNYIKKLNIKIQDKIKHLFYFTFNNYPSKFKCFVRIL